MLEDRLLDASNGEAWVEALGAGLCAVHDCVASEKLHPARLGFRV